MAGLEIQEPNDTPLLKEVFDMVVAQRRRYLSFCFEEFDLLVKSNISTICDTFNTRWLVSICDTYADSEDKEVAAKAMIIITLVNVVKLWGTDLMLRSPEIEKEKLKKYKTCQEEIWDGVITFKLASDGDMIRNMIVRHRKILKEDLVFTLIYDAILTKLTSAKSPLSGLMDKI